MAEPIEDNEPKTEDNENSWLNTHVDTTDGSPDDLAAHPELWY